MNIHNVLHIDILFFRETTGVQIQVWTRLDLLSPMKIHNFFRIHRILPYRVTEAYTTRHS
jgi:hypothetical protein